MVRHRVIAATAAGAVALGLASRNADAGLVVNETIIVNGEPTEVLVQYVGDSSPLRGALYFLGSGTPSTVVSPASDTGTPGLGQLLYNSDTATPGDSIFLGTFEDGVVLHFAYELKEILDFPAPPAYRTDDSTSVQFAYDAVTGLVGIDDIPRVFSDQDYDDMQVQLLFSTIPAPGAAAVLLAGLLAPRRRRRS